MSNDSTAGSAFHEVRIAVLQAADAGLRAFLTPGPSLPGGGLGPEEDLPACASRHLRAQLGVDAPAHMEQLAVFSAPDRIPGARTIATAYLALVRTDVVVPGGTPLTVGTGDGTLDLPPMSADHAEILRHARSRLRAKISYTNLGFALAPDEFTMSELRDIYSAVLGHRVDATNLQRVLMRRDVLEPSGGHASPGRSGGRPGALFRFTERRLRVTDRFAALRPPS